MLKGIRRAAAFGLVVALVSLSTVPAVAAPRADEAPRAMLLDLQGLADHVVELFAGWLRPISAESGCAMDPDGSPCASDLSVPADGDFTLDTEDRATGPFES